MNLEGKKQKKALHCCPEKKNRKCTKERQRAPSNAADAYWQLTIGLHTMTLSHQLLEDRTMSLFINISLPYNVAESFFLSITKSDCLHKVLSEYRYHRNFTELETTNRHCTNMCFCLWFCLKKKKKNRLKASGKVMGKLLKGLFTVGKFFGWP